MMSNDDPRHGTANGYNNLHCRCDRCRRAWADYMRDYNRRRGFLPREVYERLAAGTLAPHGTESRYSNGGCRCGACKRASAAARWRRRHADADDREYQRARRAAR